MAATKCGMPTLMTKCGMPRLMTLVHLFLPVTFVGTYLSDERDKDEK